MSASRRLGIGVIGLGRVSPAHVEGYLTLPDEAFVAAVCDIDAQKTAAVSGELGVPGFTDYHDLLAHPEVDAVVILLPHLLHHPVVAAAVAAGRHVTVEKPLAVSEKQCWELIEAAQASGVVLSVSENSRFVESYLRIKEVLDTDRIGDIRLVRAFIYGSAVAELANPDEPWKHEKYGFAAVLDAATHFFYVLRWMFEPVVSVQATVRRWSAEHGIPDSEVEDGAVATGRFANGGHFSIGRSERRGAVGRAFRGLRRPRIGGVRPAHRPRGDVPSGRVERRERVSRCHRRSARVARGVNASGSRRLRPRGPQRPHRPSPPRTRRTRCAWRRRRTVRSRPAGPRSPCEAVAVR